MIQSVKNIYVSNEEQIMKKTLLVAMLTFAMVGLTACGSTEEAAPAAEEAVVEDVAVEEAPVEEEAAVEEAAEEVPADDAAAEEAPADDAAAVSEFATQVVAAVDAKDIDALAELVAYPTYVGLGEGIEVATKEDFVAIGADALFTDELIAAVDAVDLSALEMVEAGCVLGDGTPNVTFNYVDGALAITGINY